MPRDFRQSSRNSITGRSHSKCGIKNIFMETARYLSLSRKSPNGRHGSVVSGRVIGLNLWRVIASKVRSRDSDRFGVFSHCCFSRRKSRYATG